MFYYIPQGYCSSFYANQDVLDSDYIEKYIPKNLLFVMQEP
jgi:hypothetical protein